MNVNDGRKAIEIIQGVGVILLLFVLKNVEFIGTVLNAQ